jgi:predicted  nucleic acid-binding Zn-ribbon protein
MNRQELNSKLKDLHTELMQVESLDDSERVTLESLVRDIQDILEKDHDETRSYSGLGDRLKDAVAQLEASHPRATISMREVIDQISYMGI